MRTYKVGLCDRDRDYLSALMDYANSHSSLGISIISFTGMKEVSDYIESQHLDLIITSDVSECTESGEGYFFQEIKVVPLTEVKNSINGWQVEMRSLTTIYKYQRAEDICVLIKNNLSQKKDVRNIWTTVAVYSPLGRCGKTRLAKALAKDDGVRGGLYIAAEDFSIYPDQLSNNVLFSLKSKSPELEETLSQQIHLEDGISSLTLSSVYVDMHDVTFDDMERLVTCLLRSGRYTTLVFDLGVSAINDMKIFTLFEKIYMPILRDDISVRKLELFLKVLKETGNRGVISRLHYIDVPDAEVDSEEMIRTLWMIEQDEEAEH